MDLTDLEVQFISTKGYKKNYQFRSDPKNLSRIITYIQNMPVNDQSFQIAQALIKQFGIAILMCFKPFYDKIIDDESIKQKNRQKLQRISALVAWTFKPLRCPELMFFRCFGTAKKGFNVKQKTPQQLEFIDALEHIKKCMISIKQKKKISNNDLNMLIQINQKMINKKFNQFACYYLQKMLGRLDVLRNQGKQQGQIIQKIQSKQQQIIKKQSLKKQQSQQEWIDKEYVRLIKIDDKALQQLFKYSLSFICLKISKQKLIQQIEKTPARFYTTIFSNVNQLSKDQQLLILKVDSFHYMQKFMKIKEQLQEHFKQQNIQFIGISKTLKFQNYEDKKKIQQILVKNDHSYAVINDKIKFFSLSLAAANFMEILKLGIKVQAIPD